MQDYIRKIIGARVYDVAIESPLDPLPRLSARICGSALAELGHFARSGQRLPLFPARLSTLGDTPSSS